MLLNSLRSDQLENAVGLLKEELRRMGSLILSCADATRVEAGGALAVDRHGFAALVTERIRNHPRSGVPVVRGLLCRSRGSRGGLRPLDLRCPGPGASKLLGSGQRPAFFDAAAPLVSAESVDMDKAWFGSRYDRGTADYVNCPMTEEEYDAFWQALTTAQEAEVHGFEDKMVFEGCMPVEVMARRGHDTLCYGPLKPRGLKRSPDGEGTLCRGAAAAGQCRRNSLQPGGLPDPSAVSGAAPGLFHDSGAPRCGVLRYGVMHRNTFLNSPPAAGPVLPAQIRPRISFAGQMTGVEGYVESAASGFLVGVETARRLTGRPPINFPQETAVGALALYVSIPLPPRSSP